MPVQQQQQRYPSSSAFDDVFTSPPVGVPTNPFALAAAFESQSVSVSTNPFTLDEAFGGPTAANAFSTFDSPSMRTATLIDVSGGFDGFSTSGGSARGSRQASSVYEEQAQAFTPTEPAFLTRQLSNIQFADSPSTPSRGKPSGSVVAQMVVQRVRQESAVRSEFLAATS